MATDPTSRAECLALAQRAVGGGTDWAPAEWQAQLDADSLERSGLVYFRPFRSATAYLVNPERVKLRSEGQFTEQYIDVAVTLSHLRTQDAEWCAALPNPDADGDGQPDQVDLSLKHTGWD